MAANLDAGRLDEDLQGRDPQRSRRALELLPELGEAEARRLAPVVLRLIGESTDLGVRARALRGLPALKVPFDAEIRRILETARQDREPSVKHAAAWAWCELGRPEDLGLVEIPAGAFLMGSAAGEGRPREQPQHTLHLPTFYLGKYPVTVQAYSEFLAASGYRLSGEEDFRRWNLRPDHPVVGVSWRDALEYARWSGMGLPSEAEWEKAARGTDGRRYPWGNEWRGDLANTAERWQSRWVLALSWYWRLRHRRFGTMLPVGSSSPRGDSPYGCGDLAGNVWNWTRTLWGTDWKNPTGYPYVPGDGREDLDAPSEFIRATRGGSFTHISDHARSAFRGWDPPEVRSDDVGFRLVLSPDSRDRTLAAE